MKNLLIHKTASIFVSSSCGAFSKAYLFSSYPASFQLVPCKACLPFEVSEIPNCLLGLSFVVFLKVVRDLFSYPENSIKLSSSVILPLGLELITFSYFERSLLHNSILPYLSIRRIIPIESLRESVQPNQPLFFAKHC